MVKKAKKAANFTSIKMVKYRTIETTRGTKTKLLKVSPSKLDRVDRQSQGSPSKASSSYLHSEFHASDEAHSIPSIIQIPKQKVTKSSCMKCILKQIIDPK